MGIFGVNITMLYGEGDKGFLRLQEEIMKHSDDQSLFAWKDKDAPPGSYHGLLATHPRYFEKSGHILPYTAELFATAFSMTNRGLRLDLPLVQPDRHISTALLNFPVPGTAKGFAGIQLRKVSSPSPSQTLHFVRVNYAEIEICNIRHPGSLQTVYVRNVAGFTPRKMFAMQAVQLRHNWTVGDSCRVVEVLTHSQKVAPIHLVGARFWVQRDVPFSFHLAGGITKLSASVILECKDGKRLVVMLGSSADFGMAFDVAAISNDDDGPSRSKLMFDPRAPGGCKVIGNHKVYIEAETLIHFRDKYYMVDMTVEVITGSSTGTSERAKQRGINDNKGSDTASPTGTLRK